MFTSTRLQRLAGLAVCLTMVVALVSACNPAPTPAPTTPPTAATKAPAPTAVPSTPVPPTPVPPTSTPAGPKLAQKQVIRIPLSRLGGSIDPSLSYGQGYEFVLNLFDGLTRIDFATGKLLPLAAEKWEASADGKTWTFTLKQGMTWSDGKPVTAKDFVYAVLRILDPKTKAPLASDMFTLVGAEDYNGGKSTDPASVGVKAVDDRTVQYTLKAASADFPRTVSGETFFPMPQWAIEKSGTEGDAWMKPGNIVVNGPYTLSFLKPDQGATLVRNEAYKGKKPILEKAEWVFFESYTSQSLLAFESGDLDMGWVPGTDLERVSKDAKLSKMVAEFPVAATAFIVFDTSSKPLDNVKLRRALSLAVDRERLNNIVLKKQYAPAYTVVPKQVEGYSAALALKPTAAEAKALLAEAGYPDGKGLRELEVTFPAGDERRLIMEAVQAMWLETLGVKVKLNSMESAAYSAWTKTKREKQETYDMRGIVRLTVLSTSPVGWYNAVFAPKVDYTINRWKNAAFADLIEKGQFEMDTAKRAKTYQDAEALLLADMPVIPLYHTLSRWVIQPYVKGLVLNAIESAGQIIDVRDVYIEQH